MRLNVGPMTYFGTLEQAIFAIVILLAGSFDAVMLAEGIETHPGAELWDNFLI